MRDLTYRRRADIVDFVEAHQDGDSVIAWVDACYHKGHCAEHPYEECTTIGVRGELDKRGYLSTLRDERGNCLTVVTCPARGSRDHYRVSGWIVEMSEAE